jgi:dolichol-phosphate mannosyltransferase
VPVSIEVSVVVPTYNERSNVAELARRLGDVLQGLRWEVVFVDDDSGDGTADLVRELARSDAHVRCLQRIGRRGLSRAVIEGILSTSSPLVAVMDADLQHDEQILPAMVARLRGLHGETPACDLVVATRYAPGGGTAGWDARRARMSRLATALTTKVLDCGVSDPMSGYFLMRREVFETALRRLSGEGQKVLLDILTSQPGPLRLAEVPYHFRPRQAGESKLDSAVLWEFTMLLLDKRLGRLVPARFVLFSLIGSSGVLVHFAVLGLAFRGHFMPFASAQACATLVAMTSNYALNNSLTYRDRRRRAFGWLKGLLSFYAVCGLGVAANVGVANALFAHQGWAVAALCGALVGTVWNYLASRAVTWKKA